MLYQRKRFTVLECLTELEDITKEAELCLTKLKLMPEATAWKGMNLIINSTVKRLGSKAQDENVNELFWIICAQIPPSSDWLMSSKKIPLSVGLISMPNVFVSILS